MDITVELKGVTKKFDEIPAVAHVSLRIRQGEFFSLLGPSGCGKTTTLRLIAGFETPTSGQVFINNEEVTGKRPYDRNVNTVFQNYALFPHLTVAGNIAFGLERKKVSRNEINKKIDEILNLVRLEKMGDRYPRQLSGGQQQRVALARALVLRPDVLLLDEPLGALDLKLRKEMQLELKSLQEKVGITFIYVTHDQGEALAMSDRIAVMEKGRMIQIGSPEDIYEKPKTRFVADFIGSSNFFSGRVIECRKENILVRTPGDLNMLLPASDKASPGDRVHFTIRPEKIDLLSLSDECILENRFDGDILNRIYLGNATCYIVSLSSQEQVMINVKNEYDGKRAITRSIGDRVCVAWQWENCVVLSE